MVRALPLAQTKQSSRSQPTDCPRPRQRTRVRERDCDLPGRARRWADARTSRSNGLPSPLSSPSFAGRGQPVCWWRALSLGAFCFVLLALSGCSGLLFVLVRLLFFVGAVF